jgi:hypothetical protein
VKKEKDRAVKDKDHLLDEVSVGLWFRQPVFNATCIMFNILQLYHNW